jgi:HSP20 family molecular chaperone IbpA
MTEGNKDNQYLKVLEVYTRDVGRGVARIDYDTSIDMKDKGDKYSLRLEIPRIDKDKIRLNAAKMNNGILYVELPKKTPISTAGESTRIKIE